MSGRTRGALDPAIGAYQRVSGAPVVSPRRRTHHGPHHRRGSPRAAQLIADPPATRHIAKVGVCRPRHGTTVGRSRDARPVVDACAQRCRGLLFMPRWPPGMAAVRGSVSPPHASGAHAGDEIRRRTCTVSCRRRAPHATGSDTKHHTAVAVDVQQVHRSATRAEPPALDAPGTRSRAAALGPCRSVDEVLREPDRCLGQLAPNHSRHAQGVATVAARTVALTFLQKRHQFELSLAAPHTGQGLVAPRAYATVPPMRTMALSARSAPAASGVALEIEPAYPPRPEHATTGCIHTCPSIHTCRARCRVFAAPGGHGQGARTPTDRSRPSSVSRWLASDKTGASPAPGATGGRNDALRFGSMVPRDRAMVDTPPWAQTRNEGSPPDDHHRPTPSTHQRLPAPPAPGLARAHRAGGVPPPHDRLSCLAR